MMYILSEEEYGALRKTQALDLKMKKDALQKLCTKIADEMPVKWGWVSRGEADVPKPWGCIHSTEGEWYCDKCPVTEICPSNKNWSK